MDAGVRRLGDGLGLWLLMGALWGGYDDASGPVLVRVTAKRH